MSQEAKIPANTNTHKEFSNQIRDPRSKNQTNNFTGGLGHEHYKSAFAEDKVGVQNNKALNKSSKDNKKASALEAKAESKNLPK